MEQLRELGIHPRDPRFMLIDKDKSIQNNFMTKLEKGQLEINNWKEITDLITDIYNEVKEDNKGDVADYIPQLANVDDSLFGIAMVSVDGQVFQIGDIEESFCVQSCSKPITYGITLEDYDEETVHNYVGKEPSGRNFNELCLDEDNLPHNPLINSGAIMITSLIKPNSCQSERFDHVLRYWKRLAYKVSFSNSIYLSEKDSADRNYCLGYMMQEKKSFLNGKDPEVSKRIGRTWNINDLNKNLELYFQFCSIETDILGTGLIAATLANGGVHPWSQDKIFESKTVKKILSVMFTCGMYDYSGEWGYRIGVPAKSGVSGLIYAVIPKVCGISIYSPKLDKIGNSYRGIEFFKKLTKRLNIHMFEDSVTSYKISIRHKDNTNKNILGYLLLGAAAENDIQTIKEVLSKGCNIDFQDYDNRTALHIAVCEKNINVIKYLLEHNAKSDLKDRWEKTAIDESDDEILKILQKKNSVV
jgi:glutaminase